MRGNDKQFASSRIKACSECRQQKLRCGAANDGVLPCQRCRKKRLHCEVTAAFRKTQRRTKAELRAELDSVREQLNAHQHSHRSEQSGNTLTPSLTHTPDMRARSSDVSPPLSHPDQAYGSLFDASEQSNHLVDGTDSMDPLPRSIDALGVEPTWSRAVGDVEVSSEAIEACFTLYYERFAQHLPIQDTQLQPNSCYLQSVLLFWSIVAAGARQYADDPTLLTSLAPHVTTLAGVAIVSRGKPLSTILALAILCTWPLPHDTLSRDISIVLAGALLNHALAIGLHVYGIGQDFSRTKVREDNTYIRYRARLWYISISICNRVHCSSGIPPISIPDTYRESNEPAFESPVPPSVAFQRTLNAIQSEGLLKLERHSFSTQPAVRADVINPIIEEVGDKLRVLDTKCCQESDRFYLHAAQLQVLCFHLLVPRDSLDDEKLFAMYELGCIVCETAENLESAQPNVGCLPVFVVKYVDLAAFTILKLVRSHLASSLDQDKGRQAYFFAIQLHRNMSVQSGDAFNRAVGILTQLWISKNVFTKSDGTIDSLTLRCGGRLGMSVVYDCYWWWRWEFAGQPYPYDDTEKTGNATPRPPLYAPTSNEPASILGNIYGLDDTAYTSPWTTTQDIMSLDWSQF